MTATASAAMMPGVELRLDGISEAQMDRTVQVNRLGEPEDVASAALFLASEASSWMTGASLVVDGGALLGPKLG